MKLWNIPKYSILMHQSGGSRNFWTGDTVENIVVWGLFSNWCPFTHTNIFVVRVENKMHIVHIDCMLTIIIMHFMQSKFIKTKQNFLSNRGACTWCARTRSSFGDTCVLIMDDTNFFSFKNLVLKQKNYTQFKRNMIYVSTLQLSMFYQS